MKLAIYNIIGREITTLVNEEFNRASIDVEWDAASFSSGTYLYRLSVCNFTDSKRMLLVK